MPSLRTREHLTADEVERLIEAAKGNRYGHRDALMILLTFRHGLRAAEVCDLRWEQVDFKTGDPARPPRQERHAGHTSFDRSGNAGAAQTSTRKRAIAVRVRVGARRAADGARLFAHGRAGSRRGRSRHQSARPYAPSRLRLQAGE